MENVDVTIVITTYNEEKYLPILLSSIKNQKTNLSIEVIIADDSSTDNTLKIAEATGYKIIHNIKEKGDVQDMRNKGLWLANGKTILFCDADTALSENYIEAMCRPIVDGECDTTLCKTYAILEAFYDVLPEQYSKSYLFYLKHAPRFMVKRIPVMVLPWMSLWITTMIKEKKILSIWNILHRAHTTGIVTRPELARVREGWNAPLGAGDDARYSYDVFEQSSRIKWIKNSILYISKRRVFPKDISWIINKPFGWILKLYRDMKKTDDDIKKGYDDHIR